MGCHIDIPNKSASIPLTCPGAISVWLGHLVLVSFAQNVWSLSQILVYLLGSVGRCPWLCHTCCSDKGYLNVSSGGHNMGSRTCPAFCVWQVCPLAQGDGHCEKDEKLVKLDFWIPNYIFLPQHGCKSGMLPRCQPFEHVVAMRTNRIPRLSSIFAQIRSQVRK